MKITAEMINELNSTLSTMDCIFRLRLDEDKYTYGNPNAEIVPANKMFLHSVIINPSNEFYSMIEKYFAKKGITLRYNNTGDIMWSVDGFGEG